MNDTAEQIIRSAFYQGIGGLVAAGIPPYKIDQAVARIKVELADAGLLSGGAPSEAQVERAAEALARREPMRSATAWENLHEFERSGFRESARAALEAADVASQEVIDDAADEQDDLRLHMLAPQPACLNCDEPVAESVDGVGLRAERDAALAALERVRAEADAYAEQPDVMEPCGAVAQALRTALDGAPEPETPELFPGTNAALDRLTVRKAAPAEAFCIEHGNFHAVELGDPTCEFEDGLGEPVDGEKP